jgi:hypothetical protein
MDFHRAPSVVAVKTPQLELPGQCPNIVFDSPVIDHSFLYLIR